MSPNDCVAILKNARICLHFQQSQSETRCINDEKVALQEAIRSFQERGIENHDFLSGRADPNFVFFGSVRDVAIHRGGSCLHTMIYCTIQTMVLYKNGTRVVSETDVGDAVVYCTRLGCASQSVYKHGKVSVVCFVAGREQT